MGGEFGGEWTPVYVWLDPFALHLKLSQQHCLLIGYTPQYKIKSKKKKKKREQEQYWNKSYKDSKNGSHQKNL